MNNNDHVLLESFVWKTKIIEYHISMSPESWLSVSPFSERVLSMLTCGSELILSTPESSVPGSRSESELTLVSSHSCYQESYWDVEIGIDMLYIYWILLLQMENIFIWQLKWQLSSHYNVIISQHSTSCSSNIRTDIRIVEWAARDKQSGDAKDKRVNIKWVENDQTLTN